MAPGCISTETLVAAPWGSPTISRKMTTSVGELRYVLGYSVHAAVPLADSNANHSVHCDAFTLLLEKEKRVEVDDDVDDEDDEDEDEEDDDDQDDCDDDDDDDNNNDDGR